MEIEVIVPPRSDGDELSDGLRWLTGELCKRLPNAETRFGLGGANGYGVDYENETFAMRPFYWGDCDCGYEERAAAYEASDPGHSPSCYQTELRSRMQAYDATNPEPHVRSRTEVSDIQFGVMTVTIPNRSDQEASRSHYAARRAFEESLYDELGKKFGVDPRFGAAIHCTCGCKERWQEWARENHHRPTCSLVLPNFHFKPTDFKVRWYKWIGRDNELEGEPGDVRAMLVACLNSVPVGSA